MISFEFFPPKTEEGIEKLRETRKELSRFDPKFFSVTFGAGGSTRDRTMDAVFEIHKEGFDAAPHISCISSSKSEILDLLEVYRNNNIRRVVALRGDLPSGEVSLGEFAHANELVGFIREKTGDWFHIDVAAYPEFHPESQSPSSDIRHFKGKVDAGANEAITQYFYNADAYFRFMDQCHAMDIQIPIIPGVMPIYNITQLARFSNVCGAEIPRWLRLRLQDYSDDITSLRAFGLDVVTSLCENLLANGAPGLHFYTLNQSKIITSIAERLGISKR